MISLNPARPDEQSPWEMAHAVLAALWKRRGRAALVFVAVMGTVVAGLVLAPRSYQSEAKLFVRVGRESIGLDPTATTGQTISVSDSREFEINSVVDLIDSRALRERVVELLGPDFILKTDGAALTSLPAVDRPPLPPVAPSERADALRRDQAVRRLSSSIKTSSGKRSSVITVSCRAEAPERAQCLLQTFLEAFHALHMSASRASGSHEFFEEQVRLLAEQLSSASLELSEAKNAAGMATVEGRQKTLEDQMSAIQAASVKNATTLAATDGEIAALAATVAGLPERLVTQEVTGFPDDAVGATRKQLRELQLKEQDLLTRFTKRHPSVIAIRGQIDIAEQLLAGHDPNTRQATTSHNPAREQLRLKLLSDDALAASLRAEAKSLDEQKQKTQRELAALNSHDGRVNALQQRVDVLKATLKAYTEKREMARIDQALEAGHISNVSVVQPATFMPRPVSPNKPLVLLAGAVVAAISALATALATEFAPSVMRPRAAARPVSLDPDLAR